MPRKGENIYKRKDGRWEGRFIKEYGVNRKALYGYVYGKTYNEVRQKLRKAQVKELSPPVRFSTYKTYITMDTIAVMQNRQSLFFSSLSSSLTAL